ncbi:MAG: 8-amino-7-oxononanoate synthase [Balneolaceae bacterium]|nr:8-amino-7-oxononanoate synthase [Balneolaceae bacterium]
MKNSGSTHEKLQKKLEKRQSEHRYRSLNKIDSVYTSRLLKMDGEEYLNFCSNDYLNLSNHPALKNKSIEYAERFGVGSSSSRLITGTLAIHRNLEERLASLYQKDDALLFSTGFQANSTILPAITDKNDVIITDQLCHNSILTGCLASKADFYRFRHNDMDHLETFLKRKSNGKSSEVWIVTESLFSMDGDRAPLDKIIQLSRKYGAKLYVDDAHAFGVYGENGLGFGEDYKEIDLLIGTFGKAAGSFGAFVASSKIITEALINYCSGFIYSTAPPPSIVGSIEAALDLIPDMEKERRYLHELSKFFHQKLKENSFETSENPSHILPIIEGEDKAVLKKSDELKAAGMIVTAIRPPTVPENRSRFRISLTTAHRKEDCNKLLELLSNS